MASSPYNLLFIFTDEQRRDTLSCYGNDYIHMPWLNAFAQQACIFDDAHCTNPVCTPSRGSLLTGLYPHGHGAVDNNIPLNPEARCLPECFPDEVRRTYRSEYHGKWHLGDELYPQHGYERFVSIEDAYTDYFTQGRNKADRSDYHHCLLSEGFTVGPDDVFSRCFAAQLPEHHSKPKFLADRACEFIRQHKDQPWTLTVSLLEPHMPFYGCRDGQYDPKQVPMFPNFDHFPDSDPDSQPLPQLVLDRVRAHREEGMGAEGYDRLTDDGWRDLTARYLGLCSLVDTHVGRILQTLHEAGLDDQTIVVFTSDHGELMGSHRLLTKGLLYREATRVPLLIRLPGQQHPVRLTGPTSQIDLVPTLLELLDQPVHEDLHGRSLASIMRQAVNEGTQQVSVGDAASDCVIVQDGKQTRTLVSHDGWRYSNYAASGELELYDLNNDPGERVNKVEDPAQRPRLEALHEQLLVWQQRTGDPMSLPMPTPGKR